ncbi:HAMP domain-containing sensor histidine kinase [Nonomuraea sp. NEAU-A123]|uniref:sensor histidine kinase n=1 Tax=Nonomuraea sp. NEAU-A123 TaxID=2839649 RepID=UPI001BE404E1|nr:HAMP domain-containing sensor histidine kinase [Nonomuraea sp. NEAU-A123]MBT2226939.1 HAMP domain-containing histidine kinase [Nonomuraea sp. NEAU-A123]
MFAKWSVRRRLTVVALLSTLAGYAVTAMLITPLVHALLTGYETEHAAKTARRVALAVQRIPPERIRPMVNTEEVDLIQVVDDQGMVRQASPRLLGQPPLTTDTSTGDDNRVDNVVCTSRVAGGECLIAVGYRTPVGATFWMVYAYIPVVPWYISPLYVLGVLLGVLLLSSITAYVSWLTVNRALRPVTNIKTELAEITATDLGRRVPPLPHRDELDDLAWTVNQTLDRLEHAVEQERRFAADASHDLRSPITAMRTQIEEAMLHPDEADWPRTAVALLSSLDRLQAIVTDLLTLAKLDAGAPGVGADVDLAELVEEELVRRAPGKRVERRLRTGVVVTGDRLRLTRLLANLLDNAERHAESTITVTVDERGGGAVLEVQDDGAGIAPEQRETVFRRFTRLDTSRNRDDGGTGLGLSIAREIATAHGGTLTVEDSDTGARFVLQIPRASS